MTVSLDPLINAELDMCCASEFDGIEPLSLTSDFGANVGTNFGDVAQTISMGMNLG